MPTDLTTALRLGDYVICGHYKRLIGCYVETTSFVGNHSDSPFLCGGGEGSWRGGEESTFEG